MQYDLNKKEADLTSKKDTLALDDLFSKSTEEIVDGLVKDADGDHELALRNLENYMNTHDGFNRNVLSAHQQLKNKVESMNNSKFSKMMEDVITDLDREAKINNIVYNYVINYTSAEMADNYSYTIREQRQANEELENKIKELNISNEELNKALEVAYDNLVNKKHSAFIYDTKFFKEDVEDNFSNDELHNVLEIGCAPGGRRPGDILKQVIKDTSLEYKDPIAMFFGDWTWYYDEISPEDFKKATKIIMPRLKELYNQGVIRYGHMSRE